MTLSIGTTIPLLILVGFISSIIASMIGLGGGLVSIPLIMLVIGDHPTEAKIIAYVSIAFLAVVAIFKYWKLKKKPDFRSAALILIGVIPTTTITLIYLSPMFDGDAKKYFHFFYVAVAILVLVIINLKDRIHVKKFPEWSLPLFGAFIGVLSGGIGLSGGVAFMPLLVVGLKKSLKEAAVTSLVLKLVTACTNILVTGSSGQFDIFAQDGIEWYLPLIIVIGSLAGSLLGPSIQSKISKKQMDILFNVVIGSIIAYELIKGILMVTGIW